MSAAEHHTRYLQGRVAQVYDAPNSLRPRWTVQDASSVAALLAENVRLRERVWELANELDGDPE